MPRYLSLLSFVLLASCSVGPDYKRPEFFDSSEVAKSLNVNTEASVEITKDWYKQFNDETLNQLIANSLQSSPNVNIAVQKLRQARESLKINAVQYFPTLDADGGYHYNKTSKNIGLAVSTDYYQAGLDASWEFDIWGAGRRQTEQYQALYRAAGANLANLQISLVAEVANNYINLRTAQEQLAIANKNLLLQSEIYEIVKSKYDNGLADNIALNQSQYAVETTKALIPSLEYNIEAYKNALTILAGKLPGQLDGQLVTLETNLARHKFDYDLNKLYNMPLKNIRLRPDVQLVENQLIAQNAAVGQAVAALYPNVSISGFWGYQSQKGGNLFSPDSQAFNYVPSVSLPIFHWGELTNNVKLQKDIKEEYVSMYQNSVLNAVNELKNSMTAIDKEYAKNTSYQNSEENMREVLSLTLDKYKQGLVAFSDLLTAEQNYLNAQTTTIASNGMIYQNIIAFYKAAGGGYAVAVKEETGLIF